MERIKLNLIPSGVAPTVHLSQYDDGRQFAIDLFEGDSVYVLDGTETLTVDSRKPDGHIVTLTVTNTGTSSVVVDTVEQLTAVHGQSYAKLKIEKGSVTIATLEFLIAVSRDPSENGDPSDSFIQNLETQVNGFVATAVADQYDSANVIFDNVPTAGHGNGYAVTSEGVETALSGKANNSDIPVNSDFSLSGLSDTTITTPSNNQVLSYSGGKWKNGGAVDVKNDITWNETTASGTGAYRVANIMFITYQGQSKTHANGDTLFVLPSALRPLQNWEQSFTVDGKTYGQIHVLTNGNVNINSIADNTQTGRIYFSVAYPIA